MTTFLILLLGLVFKRHEAVLNELAYARAEVEFYRSQLRKRQRVL